MPVPTSTAPALDNLLRAALTTGPQRRTVWAMLHDPIGADCVTRNAVPIKVRLRIVDDAAHGALTWHPVGAVTLDGQEVDLEILRGDRVWWCSWPRRFAAARLRVELEQRQEPVQSAADTALAGLEAWEQELARATAGALGGVDGDRRIRVLATFAPTRGYGEG